MESGLRDVAQIRLDNAHALFDEFVRSTVKDPDAATLRGLERRFAERLHIQPSYWSQIKGRSRQIGERLARQFEQLCRKPSGWMDQPHGAGAAGSAPQLAPPPSDDSAPHDDDERFIVGLVLTYYRRHPQRARARLLELLGEVLVPQSSVDKAPESPSRSGEGASAVPSKSTSPAAPADDGRSLWQQSQAGVAPLKRKR